MLLGFCIFCIHNINYNTCALFSFMRNMHHLLYNVKKNNDVVWVAQREGVFYINVMVVSRSTDLHPVSYFVIFSTFLFLIHVLYTLFLIKMKKKKYITYLYFRLEYKHSLMASSRDTMVQNRHPIQMDCRSRVH